MIILNEQTAEEIRMSLFKRLSSTFIARLDQVVGEIENHEAVVQAALNDMQKKIAKAKLALAKVHQEEQRLQSQMAEQQQGAEQWRKRAMEAARENESLALDCLNRSQNCDRRAEQLKHALTNFSENARQLSEQVETGEQKLGELKQKLVLMKARESSTQVLALTPEMDRRSEKLLEDAFDRWDLSIGENELVMGEIKMADPLEQQYLDRERKEALRRDLNKLLEGE